MRKERRIYVVGGDTGYTNWMEAEIVKHMEDSTIVLFTGGEDVCPVLYNKQPHSTTGYNWRRDKEEVVEFNKARKLGLPIIGICRGAQFGAVMAGGLLVQDQSHNYIHRIETSDGKIMLTNSTHHQRQWPFNLPDDEYELLAWAVDKDGGHQLSPYSFGESDTDDMSGQKEVEVCYYKKIQALCCQPHPEMLYGQEEWGKEFVEYCQNLITTYLE